MWLPYTFTQLLQDLFHTGNKSPDKLHPRCRDMQCNDCKEIDGTELTAGPLRSVRTWQRSDS